ncbi:FAD-dependent monooxygenase [Microbacterium sediminicola]|uniref:FAD-dependent monooxygenase n=1 Tax=Microbacterium sediminicola TaxID=415210 RepID=A0ABN2IGC5_9MICO
MNQIETEVLVVGAGLAGATAGVLLGRHGIDAMVISRAPWVANSPRAHIVNQRTMEVMRAVGLEQACEAAASPGELMANHVMMTAVNGLEFGRLWSWGGDPTRAGEYAHSPGHGCDLPQDRFEPILIGEAMRLGVTVRYRTEFVGLEQDAEGVMTTLRDRITGEEFTVRSKYVIGADGGQSPVAEAIGLPFEGTAGLAPALNVHFEADLSRHLADRPGSIFWIFQPGREGSVGNAMLRMVRPWHEWIIGFVHLGESVRSLSEEELIAAVREVVQDDEVEITIKGMYPWMINHVVAQRFQSERVLCVGDAVHRHPPMNGLGGNTCIQDSFNLVWKIAAVLRWGADPALLNTYTNERQPVGKNVVDRALAGWHQNPDVVRALGVDPKASPAERQAQFDVLFEDSDAGEQRRATFEAAKQDKRFSYHAHGTEMNQVYSSTAVAPDGSPTAQVTLDPLLHYSPSSRPGARVPHCWVERSGHRISTLDLCGPEQFTLLTRARGARWVEAARAVAAERGIPLAVHRIGPGGDVADLYGDWSRVSEIGEQGAILVRPDQHVAWRHADVADDPAAALREALTRCLALS